MRYPACVPKHRGSLQKRGGDDAAGARCGGHRRGGRRRVRNGRGDGESPSDTRAEAPRVARHAVRGTGGALRGGRREHHALAAVLPQIQDVFHRRSALIEEGHTLLARTRVHAGPDAANEIARVEQEILRPGMGAGTLHLDWPRLRTEVFAPVNALHRDLERLRGSLADRERPRRPSLSGPAKLCSRGVAVAFGGAAILALWRGTLYLGVREWVGTAAPAIEALRVMGVALMIVAAVTCLLAMGLAAWSGRIHGRG